MSSKQGFQIHSHQKRQKTTMLGAHTWRQPYWYKSGGNSKGKCSNEGNQQASGKL